MTRELTAPAIPPAGFRILGQQDAPLNPLTEQRAELEHIALALRRTRVRQLIDHGLTRLRTMAQQRRGETCVIAGNGPSLNAVDWDLLDGLDVLGANYAADHPELAKRLTLLSVVNPWVISQRPEAFTAQPFEVALPIHLALWLPEGDQAITLPAHGGYAPAKSAGEPLSTRSTVSYFNLQLATLLGYKKVLMIGFDHRYTQPDNAVEGTLLHNEEADPNHFDDSYFAGRTWQAADTARMELTYAIADVHGQRNGMQIINCTPGSALHVFAHVPLREAVATYTDSLAPSASSTQTGKRERIAWWVGALSHRKPAAVWITALLIALPSALSIAQFSWLGALAAAASCIGGVLLLHAWTAKQQVQQGEDWMQINASLNQARARAGRLGNDGS